MADGFGPVRRPSADIGEAVARAMGLPRPSRAQKRDERSLRIAIRETIDEFVHRPFEIHVPGGHYSGLSNEHLFAILASQERDFLDVNRAMVAYCERELEKALLNGGQVPSTTTLADRLTDAAVGYARGRMEGRIRDIRVRALTYRYAVAKAKAGYGDRPVGVRTKVLIESLDKARLVFS